MFSRLFFGAFFSVAHITQQQRNIVASNQLKDNVFWFKLYYIFLKRTFLFPVGAKKKKGMRINKCACRLLRKWFAYGCFLFHCALAGFLNSVHVSVYVCVCIYTISLEVIQIGAKQLTRTEIYVFLAHSLFFSFALIWEHGKFAKHFI